MFDKALSEALNASEATVDHKAQTAENKKAADDGGRVQKQANISKKNPEFLDPRTVTKDDVSNLLSNARNGVYDDNTYIPIRINTPAALIYWAYKERGDIIDNNPIAMSAGKAYQAMARRRLADNSTPHKLTVGDMLAIIEGMNTPRYIIYQESNDRYVEVVSYKTSSKEKGVAIIELSNYKDHPYMNGFEAGMYNILVTTFKPETTTLKKLLSDTNNQIIFDSEKDEPQSTSSSMVPSVLNDSPFYKNSISQNDKNGNGKVQKSVSESNSISDAERKQLQLEIINENNPAPNTYNTWVRSVDDILTFEEALNDSDYEGYDDFTPDYDRVMAEEAIRTGKATVYSSYPIEPGVFVSMSRMEAASYSGNGKVYSKQISINDVAWLDPTQGQYAKVDTDNAGKIQKSAAYSTEFDRTQKKDSEGRRLSPLQMEYFAKSVIRDKRGRLIPVYHGTKNAGFTIFSKSDEIGYFFARSLATAESYSDTKTVYAPDKNSPEFSGPANYKGYLNITNPLIIEGKGAYWNNLEAIGSRVTLDIICRSAGEDGSCNVTVKLDVDGKSKKHTFRNTDDLHRFFSETFDLTVAKGMAFYMDGMHNEKNGAKFSFSCQFAWDFERGKKGYSKTTRDITRNAYNSSLKYDGVIFKDVVDGGEGKVVKADDLYVSFESEQFKSVNNTEPSEKYDIRYSRGEGYDPYKPYVHPAYATMPEYSAPLEGNYDYQGEGYTAANGLKLFSKYSVDTARDYIMSELMNCQNLSLCII